MRRFLIRLCFLTILRFESELAAQTRSDSIDETLARVAAVHGAAGGFALAGYRMGEHALHELSIQPGSFALDVTHRTPLQAQYSCVADGWQAATGVSAGKLNLHVVEVSPEKTETVVRDRKTGRALLFRPRPES